MSTDLLSTVLAAIADPTRRAILARLAQGPATVGEIAEPFAVSKPAISQHLKVLETAGLIARSTEAQWRRCTFTPEPLDEVTRWISSRRTEWDSRIDRLEEHLRDS